MSDTLDLAESLLERTDSATSGLWPRAAAVLGRQALEEEMKRILGEDLAACSARAQLLLLPEEVGRERAGQLAFVYAALSQACHYHPYQLAPTHAELRSWLAIIRG